MEASVFSVQDPFIRYCVANLFRSKRVDRPARNVLHGIGPMEKDYLVLKRAPASRTSGKWSEDDFDVLAEGVVVGRIFKANAAPVGEPWMWTLAFGQHEDRTPTHGYAPTREAAMAAFAKSWRRE
jgi:hypothetical protein